MFKLHILHQDMECNTLLLEVSPSSILCNKLPFSPSDDVLLMWYWKFTYLETHHVVTWEVRLKVQMNEFTNQGGIF